MHDRLACRAEPLMVRFEGFALGLVAGEEPRQLLTLLVPVALRRHRLQGDRVIDDLIGGSHALGPGEEKSSGRDPKSTELLARESGIDLSNLLDGGLCEG